MKEIKKNNTNSHQKLKKRNLIEERGRGGIKAKKANI